MIKLENADQGLRRRRPATVVAADRVSFDVADGEICVLLGPSGCGKTTTLQDDQPAGRADVGQDLHRRQATPTPYDPVELRRTIGYVIQQIGLFPNMTVEENICVVPKLLGWDMRKRAHARRASCWRRSTSSPAIFLKRYPKELSGGQQQRVGVARALAADPPVLLMDEPFGAIDPINREVIQDEFLKMQRRLKKTVMFVSHDIDEAVKMADKIAIFRAGQARAVRQPRRHPRASGQRLHRRFRRHRPHAEAPAARQGRPTRCMAQRPRVSGDEPRRSGGGADERARPRVHRHRRSRGRRTATSTSTSSRDRAGRSASIGRRCPRRCASRTTCARPCR